MLIPCEKAYGPHDPEGVQQYLRSFVKKWRQAQKVDVFVWEHPVSGKDVPVRCIEADEYSVTIDFNHFLAGKDLEYWFELIDVLDERGASIK